MMPSSIHRRLQQSRPASLDEVPGGDRQERDLRAIFAQPAERSGPAADRAASGHRTASADRKVRRPALVLAAAGCTVAVLAAVAGAGLDDPDTVTSQPVPEVTNTPLAAVARAALFEAAEIAGREADVTRQPHTFWHRTGLHLNTERGSTATRVLYRDEQWISVHGDDRGLIIGRWSGGRRKVEAIEPGSSPFDLDGKISVAELLKLPTEPAALKQALLDRRRVDRRPSLSIEMLGSSPADPNVWLFSQGSKLIGHWPVRTATRAAAFRMLAELPDVRVTSGTKDPIGRTGTAVAITERAGSAGTFELRLVFDPRTSAALSQELRILEPGQQTRGFEPGSVLKAIVTKSTEWTAEKPPRLPVQTPPPSTAEPQG